jgi:hypothetical protein
MENKPLAFAQHLLELMLYFIVSTLQLTVCGRNFLYLISIQILKTTKEDFGMNKHYVTRVTFGMKTQSQDCEQHNVKGKPGRSVTVLSLRGSSSCLSYGPKNQIAAQVVTDNPTYSSIGTAFLIRAYKNLPLRRSTVFSMKQYLKMFRFISYTFT